MINRDMENKEIDEKAEKEPTVREDVKVSAADHIKIVDV